MKSEHSETYRKLGIKVGYFRRLKGMSQELLAEKIGKSTSLISAFEAPGVDAAVSLDTIFDIAKALKIPEHKLFHWDDDEALAVEQAQGL